MYFQKCATSLVAILTIITVCTAKPVHHLDRNIALDIATGQPATPPRSLPDNIRPRRTLFERAAPWTALGDGWMATVVNFTPIIVSAAAQMALTELYTGVSSHCLAGMLQGPTTPTNSLVLRIGDLQFIAESTAAMEWEVIFQFVLKMRQMVGRGSESMYTAMFAHVAGHAMMFSVRVFGYDGEPIPGN